MRLLWWQVVPRRVGGASCACLALNRPHRAGRTRMHRSALARATGARPLVSWFQQTATGLLAGGVGSAVHQHSLRHALVALGGNESARPHIRASIPDPHSTPAATPAYKLKSGRVSSAVKEKRVPNNPQNTLFVRQSGFEHLSCRELTRERRKSDPPARFPRLTDARGRSARPLSASSAGKGCLLGFACRVDLPRRSETT